LWGIVLMLHSTASSFGSLFVLRFILGTARRPRYAQADIPAGMCESCVAPLLILLISMFYRKDEQATRISWFYVMVGAVVHPVLHY
jgi:ACS family allantoate permease-like MFS transporter